MHWDMHSLGGVDLERLPDVATPAKRPVAIVVTRNHSGRLALTLPSIIRTSLSVILIDDSNDDSEVQSNQELCRALGVLYHGTQEQDKLLSRLEHPPQTDWPIAKLGLAGWTLPACRNYSLGLAVSRKFEEVLLIDDDIILPPGSYASEVVSLTNAFSAVGARTDGLPDDSVIGHLSRKYGQVQYDFITGQFVALRLDNNLPMFPPIYNEDLLFLLLASDPRRFARYGRVIQLNIPPYAIDGEKAMAQEAGEVAFEGLFESVRSGRRHAILTEEHWADVIERRRVELKQLRTVASRSDSHDVRVVDQALLALDRTRPGWLVDFFTRYFDGLEMWRLLLSDFRST